MPIYASDFAYPPILLYEESGSMDLRDFTKKDLQRVLQRFLDCMPERMEYLTQFLKVELRGTDDDLITLGEAALPWIMKPEFRTRYYEEELRQPRYDKPYLVTRQYYLLTLAGKGLAFDLGLYMAKYLHEAFPECEWRMEHRKSFAHFGLPFLTHPNSHDFSPLVNAQVCACHVADGREGYRAWSNLFRIHMGNFAGTKEKPPRVSRAVKK